MTAKPRRSLLIGNWKMHLDEKSAVRLVEALLAALPFDRLDAAVVPSFPCLRAVLDAVAATPLAVGAQNMHWEAKGAFTGEVAAPVLFEMGVRFVIIGHSERRAMFGETDAMIARKLAAARRHGLSPILCVGESEPERNSGRTREVVVAQIRAALPDRTLTSPAGLVIAYEPVWAIGTGRTPEAFEVSEAHAAIREAITDRLGEGAAAVRIVYGGSITPTNAKALLAVADVGGGLVGGASLEAASFLSIADAAAAC